MKLRVGERELDATLTGGRDTGTLRLDGEELTWSFRVLGPGHGLVHLDGRDHEVFVADGQVWVDGRVRRLEELVAGRKRGGVAPVGAGAKAAPGTPPMPGRVTAIHVRVGEQVEADQKLLSLTAMKMEVAVRAASAGVVAAVHVGVGDSVRTGQNVVELRADG